jgi:hypothetical protein
MRDIIAVIFLLLIIASCNKSEYCAKCRLYIYEFDGQGNFRKDTIFEREYCGSEYIDTYTRIELTDGWIRTIQKECN